MYSVPVPLYRFNANIIKQQDLLKILVQMVGFQLKVFARW